MKIVSIGESLGLLRAEDNGSLATTQRMRFSFGGAESNVAIGVARLSGRSRWIGRVGNDSVGERIVRELRAENVDVHVRVDQERPTALMLKESPLPGATRVTYYRENSAGSRLEPGDIPDDAVAAGDVLHISGITPSLSPSAEVAVHRAIDLARVNGATVSFDVNHRAALRRHKPARDVYLDVAHRADIVFTGLNEAAMLTGTDADALVTAEVIGRLGPGHVVVKQGDRGCLVLEDGRLHAHPAIPISPVDTVGAGDAFVAGYLAELQAGGDVEARCATAVATGAFACLHVGDWEGSPRRRDLVLLGAAEPVTR